MKILITGCAGHFGRNLLDYYGKHELITPARGESPSGRPDVVIHAAAEILDEATMYESNVLLTRRVLEFCRQVRPRKTILFGTSLEYLRQGRPISETSPIGPTTLHGRTKAEASQLAESYAVEHDLPVTLVRPFTIVGRYAKPHKFFPTLYRAALHGLPVRLGPGAHDHVFIDDCLDALDRIIRHDEATPWNVVNVGSGVQTTNREVLETFESVTGVRYEVEEVGRMRPYDSDSWVCDNRLLVEKYGARFRYDVCSGIKQFVADCRRLGLYSDPPATGVGN